MSIETSIYARLAASTALTDLVGTRIYPTDPVQATDRPFTVYKVTGSAPVVTIAGVIPVTAYTVELDHWAATLADANTMAQAATDQLNGYRGGGIVCALLSDQSAEEFNDAEEGDLYHVKQAFAVWG